MIRGLRGEQKVGKMAGVRKTNKDKTRQRERVRERERGGGGWQQWRRVKGRRGTSGKRAAHLPDGSFGSTQHAVMAVLQYGASPPDCHTVVDTNSAITLLMCVFCKIFSGTRVSRQHMVIRKSWGMSYVFFFFWKGTQPLSLKSLQSIILTGHTRIS